MKHFSVLLCLMAAPALAQQMQPGAHFIENWDLDGNGTVTVAEATERRGDVFTTFDANEDGFVDAEEYAAFDEARMAHMEDQGDHGMGAMRRANEGMMLARNDQNGDGKVSRDEFVGGAAVWMQQLDSDGDGAVTAEDFGPGRGMRAN